MRGRDGGGGRWLWSEWGAWADRQAREKRGGGSEVGDGTDLWVPAVRGEREMAVTDSGKGPSGPCRWAGLGCSVRFSFLFFFFYLFILF
jgi:hypothetical protein